MAFSYYITNQNAKDSAYKLMIKIFSQQDEIKSCTLY